MLASSVDPDQTSCSAAFDLGLHCLSRSQNWDTGLIWVKCNLQTSFIIIMKTIYKLAKAASINHFASATDCIKCIKMGNITLCVLFQDSQTTAWRRSRSF